MEFYITSYACGALREFYFVYAHESATERSIYPKRQSGASTLVLRCRRGEIQSRRTAIFRVRCMTISTSCRPTSNADHAMTVASWSLRRSAGRCIVVLGDFLSIMSTAIINEDLPSPAAAALTID